MEAVNNIIVCGNARFTMICDSLVRMEYSNQGKFEDRTTVRVIKRPAPEKFSEIRHTQCGIELFTETMKIVYKADSKPFCAANLCVYEKATNKIIWTPGRADNQNLGGVHTSLDNVTRSIIPHGVHPATTEYHSVDFESMLWYAGDYAEGYQNCDALYDPQEDIGLEQRLGTMTAEQLPEKFNRLIEERRKYPPGLLSKSGYFLYNDSKTPPETEDGWFEHERIDGNLDYYLFFYGNDYKKALGDYIKIFGSAPLAPKHTTGLWFSKYPTPAEEEYKKILERFETEGITVDVAALDLPWHKHDWFGHNWNLDCVNPETFLKYLKDRNIYSIANVHMEHLPIDDDYFNDFIKEGGVDYKPEKAWKSHMSDSLLYSDFDLNDRCQAEAFFKQFTARILDDGVDYIWYDGPCGFCNGESAPQYMTNYIFDKLTRKKKPNTRYLTLSRVGGFGSHRFPMHFTGDAFGQWEVLASEVEYMIKASHMGMNYISHDVGGQQNNPKPNIYLDPELYSRFIQYTALSPSMRIHGGQGASDESGERLPWNYDKKVMGFFTKAVQLRRSLSPYLYTLNYQAEKTGVAAFRSAPIELPDWHAGYEITDSYFMGDKIFVTPYVTPGGHRKALLPCGDWYYPLTGATVTSDGQSIVSILSIEPSITPHFIKRGSILIREANLNGNESRKSKYALEVYPAFKQSKDSVELYEDNGEDMSYRDGDYRLVSFEINENADSAKIKASLIHGDISTDYNSEKDLELRIYSNYSCTPEILIGNSKLENVIYDSDKKCYTAWISGYLNLNLGDIIINYRNEA